MIVLLNVFRIFVMYKGLIIGRGRILVRSHRNFEKSCHDEWLETTACLIAFIFSFCILFYTIFVVALGRSPYAPDIVRRMGM